VLFSVPGAASEPGDEIKIPIEVKLSNNPEAKTGLQEQLVNRYMSQLGTSQGVFVVVHMDGPNLAKSAKPVYRRSHDFKAELLAQAKEATVQSGAMLDLRVCVIDASLPAATNKRKKSKKRAKVGRTTVKAVLATPRDKRRNINASNTPAGKTTRSAPSRKKRKTGPIKRTSAGKGVKRVRNQRKG
jgi:hypothetical protein